MQARWQPALGSWPEEDGVRFRVWAPKVEVLEIIPEAARAGEAPVPLAKDRNGYFTGIVRGWTAGDRYWYRLDGRGPFPDPASRSQPEGVHRPSQIVDPHRFAWTDEQWRGLPMNEIVLYELHVGTFTPTGDFAGATERLRYLAELGVSAIELMPLAECPGVRNWGYDGVDLFAPAHYYGTPDELRNLVNEAHRVGIAVVIDVVYNHFGPDGNYLNAFSSYYFDSERHTPWGAALNFSAPHSEHVRAFFMENALHWVHEYHVDGLRLDATHAMIDEGKTHILSEMSRLVHQSSPRKVLLMAEDHRNLADMIRPEGGWGLDGVWADDFHHQVRRCLAGDHESYYRDFTGQTVDIAQTLQKGWFYCGQKSLNTSEARGTDPTGIPSNRFIICIQNHDQIGNRALGERLNHQVDSAAFRAASALLLMAPQTPLLFMGQEWAASAPFQFFTDHAAELGQLVTEGRRSEFRDFETFADPIQRELIPDPQDEATFLASRLDWSEIVREPHAAMLRLYQALLRLRRQSLLFHSHSHEATSPVEGSVVLRREAADGSATLIVAALRAGLRVPSPIDEPERWALVLSTEDPAFSTRPTPPAFQFDGAAATIDFAVPAAMIYQKSSTR